VLFRIFSVFFSIFFTFVYADAYELGRGFKINDAIQIGGYFATEMQLKTQQNIASFEDIAVLAYGDINPMFSYFAELEAVGFYSRNFSQGTDSGDQKFHIERLYGDLWLSDAYNFRFGKQITPVGYWNKEPVNVLRDTTSNPLYSMLLFPKFLTGIDINGYVPTLSGVRYHLFGQNNRDFDEEYINIPNTHFLGLALEQELSIDLNWGGSMGEYIATTNQRTMFVQVGAKYDDSIWQVLGEALVGKSSYTNQEEGVALSGYLQTMYRFTQEHAFIGRYEYFNDTHLNYKDHIAIFGYSYRPLYPISLKGEYQWHAQSGENRALFSFSVLF